MKTTRGCNGENSLTSAREKQFLDDNLPMKLAKVNIVSPTK